MNADDSFLAAIRAAPDDDGPRLVYADHLAETGDPADLARAEFIRVQLALARLPVDHSRTSPLVARQADLLQQFHAAWTAPVRGLVAGAEFRRGLLDAVSIDAGQFLTVGDELFRRVSLNRVRLLDVGRHLDRVVASPLLSRIRELDLAGTDLGNGGLHVLLRSPHLINVESLDVSFNGLDDRGAARLAESATLPSLRVLTLTDNRVGCDGARRLANAAWYPSLRVLNLTANEIGGEGVHELVSRAGPALVALRLGSNPIGDSGVSELVTSPLVRRLIDHDPRLDFRKCGLTVTACVGMANSQNLSELLELDLSENEIDDAGVKALAAGSFPLLRRLNLSGNRIDDGGGTALARSGLMKTLTQLDLSNNKLTPVAADELLAARRSPRAVVDLSGNFVTADPDDSPSRPAAS